MGAYDSSGGMNNSVRIQSITTSPEAMKYLDLSPDELNDLAAKAHGWEKKSLAFEPCWMVGEVVMQLASSYKPANNIMFALELLKEINDEGYCVAINTRDFATGEDAILISGVPTKTGNKPLPQVRIDASETDFYVQELCKAITVLYIAHKSGA